MRIALAFSLVLHIAAIMLIKFEEVKVADVQLMEVTIVEGEKNKKPGEGYPGKVIDDFIKEVAPEIYKQEQAEKDEGCLF